MDFIKLMNISLLIIGTIILVLIASLFVIEIFIPAIHSVQIVCYPEIAEENGIKANAQTTTILNKTTGEKEIIVKYFTEPTPKITKHEFCHVVQNERKVWFSASCTYPIAKFYREAECYIAENLPEGLYKIIYQDFSQ